MVKVITVGGEFIKKLGKPNPKVPVALKFKYLGRQATWELVQEETGAGWYMGSFLYFFGEDCKKLTACLNEWSFLMKGTTTDRLIIGRNAYGAILVLENANKSDYIGLLDPLHVNYYTNKDCWFTSALLTWNFEKADSFFDTSVYVAWLKKNKRMLRPNEILAIKTPLSLGGKMELDNFQVENIFDYYKSCAPIYKKALDRIKSNKK